MAGDEFIAFVRAAATGVVATVDREGNPEAALVGLGITDACELVFDSEATARKIANIACNPRVAVVVGWDDDVSLQIEGVAEVLSGAAREEYGGVYEAQLPSSRALQDGFAVVRITPRWLRYYDARPQFFRVAEGPVQRASRSGRTDS
jgi:general stress protein 26